MKKVIYILLGVAMIMLTACGTVDKLASKAGAQEVVLLDSSGNLVLVDSTKGKLVPPCNASNRAGHEECRIPFNLDTVKEDPNELKKQLEDNCKSKDCKVISVKSFLVIDHPGSTCRLFYDRANNITFQICR